MLYILDILKHLLHLARQAKKLLDYLVVLRGAYSAESIGKVKPQHVKQDKLRAVCLGRCNGDLGSCPGIEHIVGLSGYGAADNVYYRKYVRAPCLCFAQRCHRIERFTRLADDDYERFIIDKRITVTEFRSEADLDRLAHEPLKIILAHHTNMI